MSFRKTLFIFVYSLWDIFMQYPSIILTAFKFNLQRQL